MAVADIGKTTSRVIWLIGARDEGGSFSASVSDDRFTLEEFERAAIETESEIVRDLAESYHPHRNSFLAWSADLVNGDVIPAHLGQIEAIQIKAYSAASGYSLAEATTRYNIRKWRNNTANIFDATAHDASGSNLPFYYHLDHQTIEFTGYRAQAKICTFTPDYATPAHQISNEFESAIIAGTIPKLAKIGVPTALVEHYSRLYETIRASIRQGLTQMPEIDVSQRIK